MNRRGVFRYWLVGVAAIVVAGAALAVWLVTTHMGGAAEEVPVAELPEAAFQLLQKHCYHCHGKKFKGHPQFNVLDQAFMTTRPLKDGSGRFLVPHDPDASEILRIVESDKMPLSIRKLTRPEKDMLRRWIEHGALFPDREKG